MKRKVAAAAANQPKQPTTVAIHSFKIELDFD
jgi:hypothetical protein